MTSSGAERREHPRIGVTGVDAWLEPLGTRPSDARVIRCATIDLSAGGARLQCATPLRPGDRAFVALDTPEQLSTVIATVVHASEACEEIGLQFVEMGPGAEDQIIDLTRWVSGGGELP